MPRLRALQILLSEQGDKTEQISQGSNCGYWMFLGSIEVLSTSVLETGETEGRCTIGMMAVTGVTVQREEM